MFENHSEKLKLLRFSVKRSEIIWNLFFHISDVGNSQQLWRSFCFRKVKWSQNEKMKFGLTEGDILVFIRPDNVMAQLNIKPSEY